MNGAEYARLLQPMTANASRSPAARAARSTTPLMLTYSFRA